MLNILRRLSESINLYMFCEGVREWIRPYTAMVSFVITFLPSLRRKKSPPAAIAQPKIHASALHWRPGLCSGPCSVRLRAPQPDLVSSCFQTRGNSRRLVKNFSRYDVRKYSFTQRIVNIWNSLPEHVVNSSSVNSFKNNLDKF